MPSSNWQKKLLLGASLEVGDERYNEAEIRQLYDSEAYPLKRHTRRANSTKSPSYHKKGDIAAALTLPIAFDAADEPLAA